MKIDEQLESFIRGLDVVENLLEKYSPEELMQIGEAIDHLKDKEYEVIKIYKHKDEIVFKIKLPCQCDQNI